MELFKLHGTIDVDNSKANQALDETSQKGNNAQSKLSKAFGAVGKGAAVVGKTVATGLAVGGAAMGTLTVKALNMGGELEQNMGGSEAVFGKHADKMQSKAKSAFSNMGLSTSDYLATANKMGALFQGAGFSIEESMGLSSDAMQRAADVASIMGIDTSAAMEAIAGAAKGNFTMMDNLGVAMNDTTLNAYALEKGIGKTTQEMTNQEKIGLAMEMFMDKTAYAAGNYAKENETLAGALGTAKSALTNFLDGSGDVESLVDSFSNLADVVVKNLEELAPRLVKGITDVINKVIPMLPPLLQKLLPVIIDGAVSLINGLVAALPTIISALMDALPALIQGVQQIITALIEALPQIMEALVSALPTLIPLLVNGLVQMIVTLCTMMPQIIQPLIAYLPEIITAIVTALIANLPQLIEAGGQLLLGLLEGMVMLVMNIPTILGKIFTAIVDGIKALFGIHSPSTVMMEIGKNIIMGLINGIKGLFSKVSEIWGSLKTAVVKKASEIKDKTVEKFGQLKDKAVEKFNQLKDNAGKKWNSIKDTVSKAASSAKDKAVKSWNTLKDKTSTAFNNSKDKAVSAYNTLKSKVTSTASSVKDSVSSKWDSMKSKTASAFDSAKNKASSAFSSMKSSISTHVGGMYSTVSNKFGSIKTKINSVMDSAKSKVSSAISTMKSKFNFSWSLPKLKLPHFSISGKFGLNPPSVPKFGIEWYKKAMEAPMIMNSPTIFGYNAANGKFMGGGEAGSEVITGTQTLMNMIQSAVAAQNETVVYCLEKIIEILVAYFPQIIETFASMGIYLDSGMLVGELAVPMNQALGKLSVRKDRGR